MASSTQTDSSQTDPQAHVDAYPTKMPALHQEEPGQERDLELKPQFEAPTYKAAGKLAGKAALVTGGDSGIGRAVAVLFAREGADVAIVYKPEEQDDAEETRRHVEGAGRRFVGIAGDVKDPAFVIDAVERAVRELGKLDVLVNNAAHQKDKKSLEEITDEEWDKTFQTNIYAYFRFARAALKHMGEGAAIINTGSETGLQGSKELLDYSATKGAIHAFTKALAQNLVERKIRVNCVAPGPVWTPLNPQSSEAEKVAEFGQKTPMQRPAQPEEMAPAYVYFASTADSSYVTGEVLALMGGQTTAG
ncbi:short-chain dehydrogenase [Gemmatimonadetes bacterium T265]|nr:short-chain dehydrogenase [Gemmatimonadetes bacterium T265]